MNSKKTLLFILLFSSLHTFSQWEASLGAGVSIPMTGYGEVVKTGVVIFNVAGNYRFKSELSVGVKIQYARFSKDKNPADTFYGTKISVAPIIFNAEYAFNKTRNLRPYIAGGFGLSFFAVSYNSSATAIDDKQITNVSFTMMPLVGLRYKANQHLYPYIETGFMLLSDGPPIGFPEADKLTGYNFIIAGLLYRFGTR